MPDPTSPVLTAVAQYRAQLSAKDAQALGRLIDAYRRSYARLGQAVDLLLLEIGDQPMTRGQIIRLARYKALMEQIASELQGFSALTRNEIERAAELGILLGERHGRELVAITAGDLRIAGVLHQLPKDTIEQLLGFLDPAGPLYKRLQTLAPHTASLVSDAITSGVTVGYNPRKIASLVQGAFGQGLTDALRFTRTVQLWSYREANRASYVANSDIVTGWIWHAELGPRTCGSCFAMHGTLHPLDEPLNDHHNGRCAALPVVKGFPNPVVEMGEEWFRKQSPTFQRQVLGKSKYEAWQAGKFNFSQLSTTHDDAVYGPMRIEASLRSILGEQVENP